MEIKDSEFETHNHDRLHFAIVTYYDSFQALTDKFLVLDSGLDSDIKEQLKNTVLKRTGFISH